MAAKAIKNEISVVIPTLNRGPVLVDSINYLLNLAQSPRSVIIVDQTIHHPDQVDKQLKQWHEQGVINWIRLEQPSVVAAMNVGLLAANTEYVLFVDDDIKPFDDLLSQYHQYLELDVGLIAGRVIQPWDSVDGVGDNNSDNFSFNGLNNCRADYFIGANFLVRRDSAISSGGFDENFVGTAHDYEREFSDRLSHNGHRLIYCGAAAVHHLKEPSGGIRTFGHYLKTAKPHHAVGAYYYILTSKLVKRKPLKILHRLKQRVITRTHLRQPWWIPLTLIGDVLGLVWAIKLRLSGPAHIKNINS